MLRHTTVISPDLCIDAMDLSRSIIGAIANSQLLDLVPGLLRTYVMAVAVRFLQDCS